MTSPVPEVRVVHGLGLDIEAARTSRIRVDGEGSLVISRPGSSPRIVAAADVRHVVWLDGVATARIFAGPWTRLLLRVNRRSSPLGTDGVPIWMVSGSCVVLTDQGPVAAWLVDETAPAAGDASLKRQQSGSVAVARGLGLVLEPPAPDLALRRRAVRQVAVRGSRSSSWIATSASVAMLVALLLAARSWSGFDGDDVRVPAVLALVLALPVAVATLVLRRRAMRLMSVPPEPGSRAVYRPARQPEHELLQIQLGPHDVVAVAGDGSEVWLPGPAVAGGVTQIQVVLDQLRVLDAHDGLLQLLPTTRFAPDVASVEALRTAAARAGVTVETLVPPADVTAPRRASDVLRTGGWETGDISPLQVWLLWAVGLFLVVAGLATGQQHPALGWVICVGGVLVAAAWAWNRWSLRRWVTSFERRETS